MLHINRRKTWQQEPIRRVQSVGVVLYIYIYIYIWTLLFRGIWRKVQLKVRAIRLIVLVMVCVEPATILRWAANNRKERQCTTDFPKNIFQVLNSKFFLQDKSFPIFLFDTPLVTKFNFHSSSNNLTEYLITKQQIFQILIRKESVTYKYKRKYYGQVV